MAWNALALRSTSQAPSDEPVFRLFESFLLQLNHRQAMLGQDQRQLALPDLTNLWGWQFGSLAKLENLSLSRVTWRPHLFVSSVKVSMLAVHTKDGCLLRI